MYCQQNVKLTILLIASRDVSDKRLGTNDHYERT